MRKACIAQRRCGCRHAEIRHCEAHSAEANNRHCEEQSDEAISSSRLAGRLLQALGLRNDESELLVEMPWPSAAMATATAALPLGWLADFQ